MKYIWEEKDVLVGRLVNVPGRSEEWMIGYRVDIDSSSRCDLGIENPRYCFVSMQDGMIGSPKTKADIVAQLNTDGYIPVIVQQLLNERGGK